MKKWRRTVPIEPADDSALAQSDPAPEAAGERERLWPVIDVLEAEKKRSRD